MDDKTKDGKLSERIVAASDRLENRGKDSTLTQRQLGTAQSTKQKTLLYKRKISSNSSRMGSASSSSPFEKPSSIGSSLSQKPNNHVQANQISDSNAAYLIKAKRKKQEPKGI